MILAAGKGQRLKPITDNIPKPLIEVNHKPLIFYHLENLSKAGFKQIIINVWHLKEQIMNLVGDGSRWGLDIQYSEEEILLDTGGGIKHALPLLGQKPFLIVNGDIYTHYHFKQLLHYVPSHPIHLVLVPNPIDKPVGDFYIRNQQLFKVSSPEESLNSYTYSGIGIFSPQLFAKQTQTIFPLIDVLQQALSQKQISWEIYNDIWFDSGTPERLQRIESFVLKHQRL